MKAFRAYYSICELFGTLFSAPEHHEGIHDDGRTVLYVKTTNGYAHEGDREVLTRVEVAEGHMWYDLQEDDEVHINGYLAYDDADRMTLYAVTGFAYRDGEKIKEI